MFLKRFVLSVALLAVVSLVLGQASKSVKVNLDSDRLALEGHDPVAYFKEKKAIEGKEEFVHEYQGAVYRFSTQQNRDAFIAAPLSYLPQYGGWCAYAMGATGEKVEVDPETFKIIDGKLYLFYNKFFNNTLDTWNKNENALKSKADSNWKSLTEPKH